MNPTVKAFLTVLALFALSACTKKNDIATLRHEAVALAVYYAPRLESLDQRVQAIFKRGSTIPANLPGIDAVGAKLTEARDQIIQLRGIVAKAADGKSALEKQADALAKDRKAEDLEKLIDDTHSTLERSMTIIIDDLGSVESWIAQYDRGLLAGAGRPPQPENQPGSSPSATGQPAGAAPAQPPVPAQPAPGAAQPPAPAPARP